MSSKGGSLRWTIPGDQASYKRVKVVDTVETILDEVHGELRALSDECSYAASKYPESSEKREAYLLAETITRGLYDSWGLNGWATEGFWHSPVSYLKQRPRRISHRMARWARVRNCAAMLLAVAEVLTVEGAGPGMVKECQETASTLVDLKFPKLYD